MTLQQQTGILLPAIEAELHRQVSRLNEGRSIEFYKMLAYHMGWEDGSNGAPSGKRIRPLLMLLIVEACGGEWLRAISAAAAIELIHNFSLIHDDIEDKSPTRRGRETIWHKFGVPMGVNAGDAMFTIANQAMLDTVVHYPPEVVVKTAEALLAACLALTRGQYLDMAYEHRLDLVVDDYWPMVEGKTSALLSAAARIGALLGGASDETAALYSIFGRDLGLAFQVQDDILGIWGDENQTGKSVASDLVEGKRSLPVLFGLSNKSEFSRRWAEAPIREEETREVAQLLKVEGGQTYSLEQAERLTNAALKALHAAEPQGAAGEALVELAHKLLSRQS